MSEPIPSATVVLLRDTPSGMKVLLLRRNSDIAYGGSWVFPGGRIDPHEFEAAAGDALQAARLAAVRETAEEACVTITESDLLWCGPSVFPPGFFWRR
jgi:8-oxo-dGTP pyrophosphatase MutT (NUDIX family)